MKKPLLLSILFFLILSLANAQSYEGTWKGVMMQDSPVVRINFEMVLEQKEGTINGFLYRLFIVNDSLIYNTVRVTARVSDGMLIVEDDASVSRNFEEKANRKIKAAYFFKLDPKQPDADTLKGEWTTSRFKNKYMSVSGKVIIKREPRYETTQIFKRLEEKQLHTTIAFIPKKTAADIAMNRPKVEPVAEPTETKPLPETVTTVTNNTELKKDSLKITVSAKNPVPQNTEKKPTNQPAIITANQQSTNNTPPPVSNPVVKTETPLKKDSSQTSVSVNKPPINTSTAAVQPKPKPVSNPSGNHPKPVTVNPASTGNAIAKNNTQVEPIAKPEPQPPITTKPAVTTPQEKPTAVLIKTDEANTKETQPAQEQKITTGAPPVISNPIITKRATEVIQTLSVFEDSVTLSLYDNGEIDGDTVSVFLNNEKIISSVGLKASAYKHTLYFKPGETVQLTLFAENLGTIPPNSGLLVVYSGEQRYQVFFTSTLNKSAVVLLKRNE
jgi:hypothetical protein